MSTIVVASQFTMLAGQPAVGLALADIDLYLTRINNTTGVDTVVWDGTQHPTAEIDNCGTYARLYALADLDLYTYFSMAQYTGVAVLDVDYVMGAVSRDESLLTAAGVVAVWSATTRILTSSSTAPGTGLTAGTWTVLRGDILQRTFATIAADASITKVQFSFRNDKNKPDTASILAVDSTTGLIRLNGAAPGIYTATFTLPAGVLTVPPVVMARLSLGIGYYDIQVWRGAAVVQTIEMGSFSVTDDVTRTVTP